jgi:hypothetical protein
LQHRAEGKPRKSHAEVGEKRPAVSRMAEGHG